ncbi:hypothetical protein [Cruoricaptor ignavus]|uniref:hypothetical protein n=1 Tax=Cruoricaptor ignavus TaxID=1118202 RepID=UPI0011605389|nr:hypothetical protein [Cruoricaptor ignavus]
MKEESETTPQKDFEKEINLFIDHIDSLYQTSPIEFDLIENENSTLSLSGYTAKNGLSDRTPRWLCGASCVGQGFLISLWDGPAPLMDIAAAAYTYACARDC